MKNLFTWIFYPILKVNLLLLFALTPYHALFSQNISRTIDMADVLQKANEATGELVEFDGYRISFERSGNNLFNFFVSQFPSRANQEGRAVVPTHLVFKNCTFESSVDFEKFAFKGLTISNCSMDNFAVSNSDIKSLVIEDTQFSNDVELSEILSSHVEIKNNTVGHEIFMEYDSIIGGDLFVEANEIVNGEIVLSKCYVNGSLTMGNNHVSGILIENSDFDFPEYGEFNNYKLADNASSDLYITASRFYGSSSGKVFFNRGNYLNLDLRDNRFDVNVYFVENKAEERFFLVGNTFSAHVSFEKFLFSETWNELYWNQLAGYKLRYAEYGAETKEELKDEVGFSNLINIYKGLHSIFLSRGDLESANACYSEMKQLQGRKLKHEFLNDKSFGKFLRWQLNVLLKIYTNHGTDPGLAVVMSFFVILAFALLYLFFPSEWDSESLNRLLISYEQFLQRKKKTSLMPMLVVLGSVLLTLVNALTLSINSFVTLGFGSIPTRGFARYLCIIEGFIGWFLLSIFTVALINQVLA